jgi:hypothetical protein
MYEQVINVPLSLSVSLMPIHVTPGWHTRSESDSGVEYWFDTVYGREGYYTVYSDDLVHI